MEKNKLILLLLLLLMQCVYSEEVNVRPDMITVEAESAIEKGLQYLAKNQARDGSWRTNGASGSYPCAMTALAGLAILASGSTPLEGPYAKNVQKATEYILSCSSESGLIAKMSEEQRSMYGHGFSMLFLGQVYGMGVDENTQRRIKRVLINAIALTGKSQSTAGGWIYEPDSNSDEGSVTITQIQGLRSCKGAGIKVPKEIITKASEYIAKCANADGGITYSLQSRGESRPAITAAAVATLYNAGEYENPVALKALEYLIKNKDFSSGRMNQGHGFYEMLYISQAMYLSGEENWKRYFPNTLKNLLKLQEATGSWKGDYVGDVYGTSIALLVMQLPYQFLPILQR
jgi:prenyltransferase beta subunit